MTGHAAWIICVTEFCIARKMGLAGSRPKEGSSRSLFSAMIFEACSKVIWRSFEARLSKTASRGEVRLVRQNTAVMVSSLRSSYNTCAPIEPVAPVRIFRVLVVCQIQNVVEKERDSPHSSSSRCWIGGCALGRRSTSGLGPAWLRYHLRRPNYALRSA